MAEERVEARTNKDWGKADELRDAIAELGFEVQDTPQGPVLVPKKD
jgi:cysteinyl-tRNA synthetase